MRRHLHKAGIPSSMAGRGLGSAYRSPEAKDLLYWLDAVLSAETAGAQSLANQLRYFATPLIGLSATECHHVADDPLAQARWAEQLINDGQLIRRHGPLTPLLRRLDEADLRRRILSLAQGERQLTIGATSARSSKIGGPQVRKIP